MNRLCKIVLFVAVVLAGSAVARANVRLPKVFGDHMVLQRQQPVRIWGWAQPGEQVTIQFAGQKLSAAADTAGKWQVKLAPMQANSTPQDLVVAGQNTLTLKDILVGDVWVCSGQSNMAFGLGGANAPEDIQSADFPQIRFRSYWEHFAGTPQEDVTGGDWYRMSPQSAAGCTAVGFYFARKIHREVGVPIGLLESTVGGTEIECWMPPQAFSDYPANAEIGRRLQQAVDAWKKSLPGALDQYDAWIAETRKALAANEPVPPAPRMPTHPNEDRDHWVRIQSLYNGMIHPLTPFNIKGVIWYQGESNGAENQSYVEKTRAMVEVWRKLWGNEFPYYYVQLTNFAEDKNTPAGGDGWAACREAQLHTLAFPRTGMAVTIDVGEAGDIHPKNKQDVGERLALWALAKDYGKTSLVYSGPLYKSMQVEGNKIRIRFDHTGAGLMVGKKDGRKPAIADPAGRLKRFAIAGADKNWVWADATVDGDTVIVSSPQVPSPVAVRYAYSMNPEGCNLYNKEGLPASPFRTDSW